VFIVLINTKKNNLKQTDLQVIGINLVCKVNEVV